MSSSPIQAQRLHQLLVPWAFMVLGEEPQHHMICTPLPTLCPVSLPHCDHPTPGTLASNTADTFLPLGFLLWCFSLPAPTYMDTVFSSFKSLLSSHSHDFLSRTPEALHMYWSLPISLAPSQPFFLDAPISQYLPLFYHFCKICPCLCEAPSGSVHCGSLASSSLPEAQIDPRDYHTDG